MEIVPGRKFSHTVYHKDSPARTTLHVYLGGDGTPYAGVAPSRDPTPRNPLVLELMRADPDQSIYLGRPCYHLHASRESCKPEMWTTGRYSPDVVASMTAALRRVMDREQFDRISFFGYSGGGALAVLLARQFPQTEAVITIAANLDIDAWADKRGYPKLASSINPVLGGPLPQTIIQRHYAGGRDRVVEPDLVARSAKRLGAKSQVIETYGHVCCWHKLWPDILSSLSVEQRSHGGKLSEQQTR